MGLLPEAMRNYLLRLGWSHGDDEIITTEQAIEWFSLDAIGRSPARFDMAKLTNLNYHYLRESDNDRLADLVKPFLEERAGGPVDDDALARVRHGMSGLKERAKTLLELADSAMIYVKKRPLDFTDKAAKLLTDDARALLARLRARLDGIEDWREETLDSAVRQFAEDEGLKLGKVAQPLRAGLTGSHVSPGIFEVMVVLGRQECLARLGDLNG